MTVLKEMEARVAPAIRARQEKKFAALLQRVLRSNEFYRAKYAPLNFAPQRKVGLSDVRELPFTTRKELVDDQRSHPYYGSNLSFPPSRFTRVHRSSGRKDTSLLWPDTAESWAWWVECGADAFRAAGITEADSVFIASTLGPDVDFFVAFEAAQQAGALVLPETGIVTRKAAEILRIHEPRVLVASLEDAARLGESLTDAGEDPRALAVDTIVVPGGCHPPFSDAHFELESTWGAEVKRLVCSTEAGIWGYSCSDKHRVHVNETEFVAEVIDPSTGEPSPPDDTNTRHGELVLTNLGRIGSPLIRYRTGHTVAIARRPCPCGLETAVLEVVAT